MSTLCRARMRHAAVPRALLPATGRGTDQTQPCQQKRPGLGLGYGGGKSELIAGNALQRECVGNADTQVARRDVSR